ncbi:MAG: NYN domain-containing protein [Myxococcales bacterium]
MRPLCALFVDYENIYYSIVNQRKDLAANDTTLSIIEAVRTTLEAKHGLEIVLGRAYADFERIGNNAQGRLQILGIEPRFAVGTNHKGSADITLALDALEMLFTRTDILHFALVSGDRDYLPLLRRFKERAKGLWVIGFGSTTSGDLRESVGEERFLDAEQYLPPAPYVEERLATDQDPALVDEETVCLRLLMEARRRYDSAEIWLSPFVQKDMDTAFGHVDREGRLRLVNALKARGLLRIEQRPGVPHNYAVIVVNDPTLPPRESLPELDSAPEPSVLGVPTRG